MARMPDSPSTMTSLTSAAVRRHKGDAARSALKNRFPHIFATASGLAETTADERQPDLPIIASRRDLIFPEPKSSIVPKYLEFMIRQLRQRGFHLLR